MISHGVEISIAGGGADEKDEFKIHTTCFIYNTIVLLCRKRQMLLSIVKNKVTNMRLSTHMFKAPILGFTSRLICSLYLAHEDKFSLWHVGLLAKVFPHAIQ